MLTGKRKLEYQRDYLKRWRRADTLARHRAIAEFPPLKTVTQLDALLASGVIPEVKEFVARERKRILEELRG